MGPGVSRGLKASLAGGFKSPLQKSAASGAASSKDTTGSKDSAGGSAAASRGKLGGLGATLGRGGQLTGMFGGGPAYKVSGLRRPVRK